MKKPEEIKKGLEICYEDIDCSECPYLANCFNDDTAPYGAVMPDALAYIQQLEAQVPRWISAKTPPKEWRENDKDGTLINFQVYSPEYGVDIGNWVETAKMWVIMGLPAKVTHWMPLPKAPKEDAHAAD